METSEKTHLLPSKGKPRSEAIFQEKSWGIYPILFLIFLALLCAQLLGNYLAGVIFNEGVDEGGKEGWMWSRARADRELTWHRCYDGVYDCAVLDVRCFAVIYFCLQMMGMSKLGV